MVDEAKAFCPACGHAFVEEQERSASSDFEEMDSTVQLGQTMYNQMLSDMGLNISKSPNAEEKRIEVIEPEPVSVKPRPPEPVADRPKSNTLKWILIGGALAIVALAVLIIAVAAIIVYWSGLRS